MNVLSVRILLQFTWPCLHDRCLTGNQVVSGVTSASVPLPLQCWFSFRVRGRLSSSYQPTNGIYLAVSGLAVKMARVGKRYCLTTPRHGHLGSWRDGLSFHLSPKGLLPAWLRGVLKTPGWRSLSSCPSWLWWRFWSGVGGQGCPCCWEHLPLVDPALMFSDILVRADPAQSGYQS